MTAFTILFALAVLFAIAAKIAEWRERSSASSASDEPQGENRQAAHRPAPGVTELSNHGLALLNELDRARQTHEEAIRRHRAALEELEIEGKKIKSGLEGESRLDAYLRARLGDEWTIIAGYRAGEGEIDRILVGPSGVFAFEVKNVGGTIHCDGDRWWRDKTDRRGNVIESGIPIQDNGGRGPSKQLNDAADALESWLKKHGKDVGVVRAVVFTNPGASIGSIERARVHVVCTLKNLDLGRLFARATPLSADQVRQIATGIRSHHQWFSKKEREWKDASASMAFQ